MKDKLQRTRSLEKLVELRKLQVNSDPELTTPCDNGPNVEGTIRQLYIKLFGPLQRGKCVCHHCDVLYPPNTKSKCINPRHWWIGTYKQNSQDMLAKGRRKSWYSKWLLKK